MIQYATTKPFHDVTIEGEGTHQRTCQAEDRGNENENLETVKSQINECQT